jgi:hypothetical protein
VRPLDPLSARGPRLEGIKQLIEGAASRDHLAVEGYIFVKNNRIGQKT